MEKREAQLDARLVEYAKTENWSKVLEELDQYEKNNERRHAKHRAGLDITLADREPYEDELYRTADVLKLGHSENWDDSLVKKTEELYQLPLDYDVSMAVQELTILQQEVLLKNVVLDIPTKTLAKNMRCTVRNVTKHRQRAIEKIRRLVAEGKQHKSEDSCDEI